MSETKRRARGEAPGDVDFQSEPNRQTRVTLSKDVSSKYRKIFPKNSAGRGGLKKKRPFDDGSNPPGMRPQRAPEGEPRSGRPARRFGEERPNFGDRPARRAGGDRPNFGDRPPRRSGEERSNFGDRPRMGDRPNFGGRAPYPRKDDHDGLVVRAVLNRELPVATREVREVQDLILATANEMLGLVERLEDSHRQLYQIMTQAANEYQLLGDILTPAREHLDQARSAVVKLSEEINFKDQAGERLARVASFCAALTAVAGRSSAERSPEPAHKKWPGSKFSADRVEIPHRFKNPGDENEEQKREDADSHPTDL